MTATRKDGFKVLGIGAATCVACCAGPILAFFGGLSLAGVLSTAFIGGAGVLIAVAAAVGYLIVRQRRAHSSCAVGDVETVTVGAPSRRPPT
jgi:hypothetical protein